MFDGQLSPLESRPPFRSDSNLSMSARACMGRFRASGVFAKAVYAARVTGSAPPLRFAMIRAATNPLPDVVSRRTLWTCRRRTRRHPSADFKNFIFIRLPTFMVCHEVKHIYIDSPYNRWLSPNICSASTHFSCPWRNAGLPVFRPLEGPKTRSQLDPIA